MDNCSPDICIRGWIGLFSDFDEFVEMMMPSTASASGGLAQGGNISGAGTGMRQ